MPEATQLKEYSKWKANRVYVNEDAQKIIILEPSKEYTREDGTKGIYYHRFYRETRPLYYRLLPLQSKVDFPTKEDTNFYHIKGGRKLGKGQYGK